MSFVQIIWVVIVVSGVASLVARWLHGRRKKAATDRLIKAAADRLSTKLDQGFPWLTECDPEREAAWVDRNRDVLRKEFGDNFIAVLNCEVIADAPTSAELGEKLQAIKPSLPPFTVCLAEPEELICPG